MTRGGASGTNGTAEHRTSRSKPERGSPFRSWQLDNKKGTMKRYGLRPEHAVRNPIHALPANGCRAVSVCGGASLAAQSQQDKSAESAASLWAGPPATSLFLGSARAAKGCQGTHIRAQFGLLGHASNFRQVQLVLGPRGGLFVGTATPHLLKKVAPTRRLTARHSKARAGSRALHATGPRAHASWPLQSAVIRLPFLVRAFWGSTSDNTIRCRQIGHGIGSRRQPQTPSHPSTIPGH